MPNSREQQEIVGDLIRHAVPINAPNDNYVTRDEFDSAISHVETKIENGQLKVKLWVVIGVLSIIVTLGGSGVAAYTSIITKLDRVTSVGMAAELANSRLDERSRWIAAKDARDEKQDAALKRLDPRYETMPYREPPR